MPLEGRREERIKRADAEHDGARDHDRIAFEMVAEACSGMIAPAGIR